MIVFTIHYNNSRFHCLFSLPNSAKAKRPPLPLQAHPKGGRPHDLATDPHLPVISRPKRGISRKGIRPAKIGIPLLDKPTGPEVPKRGHVWHPREGTHHDENGMMNRWTKKKGMHLSNQTFESLGESQDFTQRPMAKDFSFKRGEVGSFTFKTEVCSHKKNAKKTDVTNIQNAVRKTKSEKLEFQPT